jgi:hypothetical protein
MSKVSKTARASAGVQVKEKKVIPDADLIKNLRNEVASGLYPTIQGSHALLRAYDEQAKQLEEALTLAEGFKAEIHGALDLLNRHLTGRKEEGGYKDLDDALRQLLQAYITNRDLLQEVSVCGRTTTEVGGEIPVPVEPGLTATQGQDSIGA